MKYDDDIFYNNDRFIEYGDKIPTGPLGDIFDDELEMMSYTHMSKAARLSCAPYHSPKEVERKTKNKGIFTKGSCILLSISLLATLGIKLSNKLEGDNAKNEAAYELSYMVNDNTHNTGSNGEYFYSHESIASDILNYSGNRDMDSVIFACYTNINYHVIEQMDIIFRTMKNYIDAEPEKYSDDVIRACYYSSFEEYLSAHNFKDVDDYKKTMAQIMVAYKEKNGSSHEYQDLLGTLYEGDNYGSR